VAVAADTDSEQEAVPGEVLQGADLLGRPYDGPQWQNEDAVGESDAGGAPGGPMAAPDKWDKPPDLAPATRQFLVDLADTAARRWQEKDHGIWEVRGEPRHFVYSKLMCWVALERATALADRLGASDRAQAWAHTQDQIHKAILTRGWSDRVNAFTQSLAPTTSTPPA
jgi:hypothetical protein